MSAALALHESRVSDIALAGGRARIYFSVAYVHRSKGRPGREPSSVWVQEAQLTVDDAVLSSPLPRLPNTIIEGFLEVGGVRHELLPLPFKRRREAILCVTFADGTEFEIAGCRPVLELAGNPMHVEDIG